MLDYESATKNKPEIYDHALLVLMWKHLHERKRRIGSTLWEITSGVLFFGVFFIASQTIQRQHSRDTLIPDINISQIFYTPEEDEETPLMKRVAMKLMMDNNYNTLGTLRGFRNEAELYDSLKTLDKSGVAVVIFENNKTSNDFKYSIGRVSEEQNELDSILYGFIKMERPEGGTSTNLAKLQWLIDSVYMEQQAEQNISHTIRLQDTPESVSRPLHVIHSFLIMCTVIAPLPYFLHSSSRLIVERRSGLKELMKMMSVTPNTLRFSHLLDTAFVAIIYAFLITICLKVTSTPILENSNGIIVAITIIIHFMNTTSLAFITSSLSQDFNHADSLAMLIFMCFAIVDFVWYTSAVPSRLLICLVCCVLPHAPIYIFWDEVIALEMLGKGVNFINIFKSHTIKGIPVVWVWGFFLVQLVVIMVLAWYIDLIRPGRYGIPEHWKFPCTQSYWSKKKKVAFHVTAEKGKVLRDDRYFEKGPKKVKVAIKVVNVTKIFRTFGEREVQALDSINLDIYKGEVTVLLGANRAGKTTLLYIITGMYSSTHGTVYINGLDIENRIQELRKDFALCPQNNVTFDYLTVRENIRFFEMLKSLKELQESCATRLMRKLKLTDDADFFSCQLCEGKKRCLQVACALAGGSDVLVLDEPTLGMDSEARHSLWDIILEMRGYKTVLISTSCLEEADVLGDRIALLNNGRLRCHGTPSFLKDAIGAGFTLSISFKYSTNAEEVRDLVESMIPLATSKMFENKRIIFKLPSKEHEQFPKLFDYLEEHKRELGIALIEVGMFMEEIFLGFIDQEKDYDLVIDSSLRNIHDLSVEGFPLLLQQMKVLIVRAFIYMWRKKTHLIVLQILIPILSLIIITVTSNAYFGYGIRYKRHLVGEGGLRLLYNTGPYRRSGALDNLRTGDSDIIPMYSSDFAKDLNHPRTVGIKMAENISTIYYPVNSQALISKAVNIFSNVYMSVHYPYIANHSIDTTYGDIMMLRSSNIVRPKTLFLCMAWSLWIVFLTVLPLVPHILLSILEYASGTRHNHYMAGCAPVVHWAAKLTAQAALYVAIVPVTVLLVATLLEFDRTLNQFQYLGCVTALLLVFGPAFLANIYVLSFFLHENHAISVIYVMSLVFGILSPILLYVLGKLKQSLAWLVAPYCILLVLAYTSPVFAFSMCLCRLTSLARLNAYCRLNKHLCPDLVVEDFLFSAQKCCDSPSNSPYRYFVSLDSGLFDLLMLILHFFVNSAIVILVEMNWFPNPVRCLMNYMYKEPTQAYDEDSVKREMVYVERKIRDRDFEPNALLAYNLHTHFFASFKKIKDSRFIAPVKGVSFSAKHGECICLLGPNGAGKKSTLLMLAGCLPITRGEACIEGTCITRRRSEYLHKIYLISTDTGLDRFLTGHQNLLLMSKLQGYSDYTCNRLARQMLAFMGLQSFTDTNVSNYSDSCSRRLALCITLIVGPVVALLDEPMSMVDPFTRPLIVRALKRLLETESAVVVSETSLERHQMELIFDRVAIMFGGHFAALGTPAEVNASLAMGYSVRIKLRMVIAYKTRIHNARDAQVSPQSSVTSMTSTAESRDAENRSKDTPALSTIPDRDNKADVNNEQYTPRRRKTSILYSEDLKNLKKDMEQIFPTSELTNEHLCMLYYYIQDLEKQLQYSKLFTEMEGLKQKYEDVVEDYTLSVASVDELYRNLQKQQDFKKIVLPHRSSSKTEVI